MKLSLFNTKTKKREVFIPINPKLIKMYVCGPTVYDYPHIGNARSVVIYDLLYRILKLIYGESKVRYVRNITDVDDKIIDRAIQDKKTINKLTNETTEIFHQHMEYLGCQAPNIEPKATEHINEMVVMIEKLLTLSFAYKINNHVYFDITKFDRYTELSGRSLDEMFAGVRIDKSEEKKHPGDFVLWKPAKETDDISAKFDSPFGLGRPGWHIECSAMSHKYLGENFDIHGGGIDLIFPHHTNEVAQSICAFPGANFANYWVHNGFLTVNHEKMSKSLGNFLTVKDFIEQNINGDVARFFLLGSHYRKPLDYNDKEIADAKKTLAYWYNAIRDIPEDELMIDISLPEEFINHLLDDMNTHMAITVINNYAKQVHTTNQKEEKISAAKKMLAAAKFLGLMRQNTAQWFHGDIDTKEIESLIAKRKQAKADKDWALADKIRQDLQHKGIIIEDNPGGITNWKVIK
ncbi:MAG: cysteine--tRNA ligase [Rickettsiaceae bacterium]|nr:cysteine--tRNA ligase [Rickettsiaceae bacterium]